jgi:hypothetical protein
MKTKNIFFAAGLLATAFQASAQLTTVVGMSKNPLQIKIDKVSPFCHGDQNGKILLSISGGQEPYYVNNQMITGNIFTMNYLGAGTYNFNITDNAVSFTTAQVNLVDPGDLNVSSIVTNASTYHGSDGAINLIVNEVNPTFIWEELTPNDNNTLVLTAEDQSGLSAGFYGVTITNEKGCSTHKKYEVTQPNTPVIGVPSDPGVVGGDGSAVSSNISVYPNPSSGHVTLRADATVRTAVITSDLGIVLKTVDFKNDGALANLDLNPGVYTLISIDENGNRATERIVIR